MPDRLTVCTRCETVIRSAGGERRIPAVGGWQFATYGACGGALVEVLKLLHWVGQRQETRRTSTGCLKVLPGARAVCAKNERNSVASGVEIRKARAHGLGIAKRGD